MFELEGQNTRTNLHGVRNQQEAWAILGVQNLKFEPLETEESALSHASLPTVHIQFTLQ